MVKSFVADMGIPNAGRTDSRAEYTNSTFVDQCNDIEIRHVLTAPYTLQQNDPVRRGLSTALKVGHAAQIELNKLFPDIHLELLKEVQNPNGTSFWLKLVLWACEGLNCSATTANSGMLSAHEVLYGGLPPMLVLPFCKPAYHRVSRRRKMEPPRYAHGFS